MLALLLHYFGLRSVRSILRARRIAEIINQQF